jgi:uncharacterized membrane protein
MPRFARRLKKHEGTLRVEAFSDGVFAIAATLLVVDLKPPRGAMTGAQLVDALVAEWPTYVSYAMSFLYLGIIWAHHHAVYRLLKRTDQVFLTINILFLMVIAVLPFPTAILGEYLGERGERHRIATLVYTGTLFVTALLFNALWLWGKHERRLIDDMVGAGGRRDHRARDGALLPAAVRAAAVVRAPRAARSCRHRSGRVTRLTPGPRMRPSLR